MFEDCFPFAGTKTLKHLQILGLLITLTNMVFFSDIQYGPWSSCSTADLLKVASDRTARTLNRSVVVVMIVVAVDILRLFDKAWHASLLLKLKSYRFQGFSLMKNHLFRILDCVTLLEPWFALWSFSLLWLPFFSIHGNRVLNRKPSSYIYF